ncbi:MAG: hypothetical protein K8I27_07695 [Planctomycetes bacterium]|nr:hypothetical protein [Planctomycetota bacterium]
MPKIKLTPVDPGPAPAGSAMFVKLLGLVVMALALVGIVYMLLTFSWEEERTSWDWQPEDIRTNFDPIRTPEELQAHFDKLKKDWLDKNPIQFPDGLPPGNDSKPPGNTGGVQTPFGNDEPVAPPSDWTPASGVDGREIKRQQIEDELKLAGSLTAPPVFELLDETHEFLDFQPFEDASSTRSMQEHTVYKGRQAPTYEMLGVKLVGKLPSGLAGAKGAWYWGESQEALDAYRMKAFAAEGRLFDLYEIAPEQAIILPDGTTVERYYEGAVALLGPKAMPDEYPIEHRVVLFQTLKLPESLQPWLNTRGHVAHDDKLVTEHVMVKFNGVFLRRWVYSREVSPFSTAAKQVRTQAHAPLLLTTDVAISDMPRHELTDELLQQVRDALRADPIFLETEAAYYAMLARANNPDDTIDVVAEVGYFDLSGEETGPRYRGQGVHVQGMIGDNYAPVILPPNISGLRRIFRALVLDDTANLESPKRYMVDMVEPPTGLEPRAIVDFDARYYRNIFETDSASSTIRPLLIVRRVRGIAEDDEGGEWVWALVGVGGVFVLLVVLTFFILSERRERARFEASTLERSRERLQKRGGLKLKPLPEAKGDPPTKPDDAK